MPLNLDSAFTDMFPLQSLENETSSVSTLRLLCKWCGVCSTSHVRCNQIAAGKRVYPTRVLEISLDETDTEWKLHVPTCDNVSVQPYITLSYRWGNEPNLVLLTSNIEEFRLGKPIRNLPQTYKDLITVARSLSVRYIWIDALCILQDSAEDWEVELFNMQHVYANAFCNIAASASSDPNGGLFRTRDPSAVRPGQIAASFSAPTLKLYHIFDKSYSQRQVLNGPLHNRGWVFQERLLAPRVIHFARNQIYWECFTQSKCEAFPAGIPLHSTLKDFDCLWELKEEQSSRSSVHLFNTWNGLVKEYTRCALTKRSDKLVAIAGLASLFHERSNDQYIAGLWRAHLAEYLVWRVYEPIMKLGTDYRAPSWSWAAVDGPVHPQGCSASTKMHITIEDVHIENSGSSMLGATANGYLRLHGIIIDATVHPQIDSELHKISTQECDMHVQMFPDHLGIAFEEKSIHCLVLKTEPEHSMRSDGTIQSVSNAVVFLVLEVQCSTSCVYKRIGHFVVRDGATLNKLAVIASEDGSVQSMNGSQRSTIVLI